MVYMNQVAPFKKLFEEQNQILLRISNQLEETTELLKELKKEKKD